MSRILLLSLLIWTFNASLASGSSGEPGYFGLRLRYFEEKGSAEGRIEIVEVLANGPSRAAGLLVGDVILRINGVAFRFPHWEEVMAKGGPLSWASPGTEVILDIRRGGVPHAIKIVAAEPPAEAIERRQRLRESRWMQLADEIINRLARENAKIKIERPGKSKDIRVVDARLTAEEQEALAFELNKTGMRLLFDNLAEGATAWLSLSEHSSGHPALEVLPGSATD